MVFIIALPTTAFAVPNFFTLLTMCAHFFSPCYTNYSARGISTSNLGSKSAND